jgi:NAD(P)-dependent dehydrogenase (short-subunit alcohol dehydrogenase family)
MPRVVKRSASQAITSGPSRRGVPLPQFVPPQLSHIPALSVYSASKAAIRNFARGWILDLAARKIRVNVLAPGATSTPGWHALSSSEDTHREMIKFAETTTPLGRLGDPDEIASAALFLASEDSSFVTGIELFVDGGSAQI